MPKEVVVASGRRLIADAICMSLAAASGGALAPRVFEPALEETGIVPDSILVVDLDALVGSAEDMEELAGRRGWSRRVGYFDSFDASTAEIAFGLGITALFPLTEPATRLVDLVLSGTATRSVASDGVTGDQLRRIRSLSPRELEVLQHLARGEPVTAIAHLLGISTHTVNTHKRRLYRKLEVQTLSAAVSLAVAAGAASPGGAGDAALRNERSWQ